MSLPPKYRGLDSREISRAEIDELIDLQALAYADQNAYFEKVTAWNRTDSLTRGPQPTRPPSSLSPEQTKQYENLNRKFRFADIRKRFENLDPPVLSRAEVEEIIGLEQAEAVLSLEFEKKLAAWQLENPATRETLTSLYESRTFENNTRLQELRGKINNAQEIDAIRERVENLSPRHSVSLSDSEINELSELQAKQQKTEEVLSQALIKAQKQRQLTGEPFSEEDAMQNIPKHLLQEMIDTEIRLRDIKAPLAAAENADRIHDELIKLSQESGVAILSGEVSETIALNAEMDRIRDRTEIAAVQKWLDEGGTSFEELSMLNDEDYARVKEIKARIAEISAPLTDAKNAALEARNPALRQQRLEQESYQKWQSDWQDKKQAGLVPAGAPVNMPTYAQLQDRVNDYSAKLKTRADKVGYTLTETDLKRLDALNTEMLEIRKAVYDMEADGSSRAIGKHGYKEPTFGLSAGMYKVKMIERKQAAILSGLSEAETLQAGSASPQSPDFDSEPFAQIEGPYLPENLYGAETIIEEFRHRGVEISQSEIDALRAFKSELENK